MGRGGGACLAFVLLLASGCSSLPWPFARPDGLARGFTQQDLAGELAAYAARFGSVVNDVSQEIHDRSELRAVRRSALVWRLRMPPLVEETAYRESPQLAYVATALVATAQQRYLAEGDGRALFGELQPLAIEAADTLVDDVLAIGERFLTRRQLEDVRERVHEFADKYPIQGRDFAVQRIPRAAVAAEAQESLGWLISLPLAPFTALRGVDTGAQAIHEFNRTAKEFAQIAKQMPERVRGQLELFVYDLEDRETVEKSVAAIDRAATSSERVASLVERLPAELRRTLAESQGSVEAAARAVEQMQALAGPLVETSARLEQASAHWLAMVGPKDARPQEPGKPPFELRWQATADSIGAAAVELRGLAGELQALSRTDALDAAVDRIFWRAAALVVLFFAALLGYRVLATRLTRRLPGPP